MGFKFFIKNHKRIQKNQSTEWKNKTRDYKNKGITKGKGRWIRPACSVVPDIALAREQILELDKATADLSFWFQAGAWLGFLNGIRSSDLNDLPCRASPHLEAWAFVILASRLEAHAEINTVQVLKAGPNKWRFGGVDQVHTHVRKDRLKLAEADQIRIICHYNGNNSPNGRARRWTWTVKV